MTTGNAAYTVEPRRDTHGWPCESSGPTMPTRGTSPLGRTTGSESCRESDLNVFWTGSTHCRWSRACLEGHPQELGERGTR